MYINFSLGSEEVRNQIPGSLNVPYGSGEREVFDIFGTDLADGK